MGHMQLVMSTLEPITHLMSMLATVVEGINAQEERVELGILVALPISLNAL